MRPDGVVANGIVVGKFTVFALDREIVHAGWAVNLGDRLDRDNLIACNKVNLVAERNLAPKIHPFK